MIQDIRNENELKIKILKLENEKLSWTNNAKKNVNKQPKLESLVIEPVVGNQMSNDEFKKVVRDNLGIKKNGLKINKFYSTKGNKVIILCEEPNQI